MVFMISHKVMKEFVLASHWQEISTMWSMTAAICACLPHVAQIEEPYFLLLFLGAYIVQIWSTLM